MASLQSPTQHNIKIGPYRDRLLQDFCAVVSDVSIRFEKSGEPIEAADPYASLLVICIERCMAHGLKRGFLDDRTVFEFVKVLARNKFTNENPFLLNDVKTVEKCYTLDVKAKSRAWLRHCLNEHHLPENIGVLARNTRLLELWYEEYSLFRHEQIRSVCECLAQLENVKFRLKVNDKDLENPRNWEIEPEVFRTTRKLGVLKRKKKKKDRKEKKEKKEKKKRKKYGGKKRTMVFGDEGEAVAEDVATSDDVGWRRKGSRNLESFSDTSEFITDDPGSTDAETTDGGLPSVDEYGEYYQKTGREIRNSGATGDDSSPISAESSEESKSDSDNMRKDSTAERLEENRQLHELRRAVEEKREEQQAQRLAADQRRQITIEERNNQDDDAKAESVIQDIGQTMSNGLAFEHDQRSENAPFLNQNAEQIDVVIDENGAYSEEVDKEPEVVDTGHPPDSQSRDQQSSELYTSSSPLPPAADDVTAVVEEIAKDNIGVSATSLADEFKAMEERASPEEGIDQHHFGQLRSTTGASNSEFSSRVAHDSSFNNASELADDNIKQATTSSLNTTESATDVSSTITMRFNNSKISNAKTAHLSNEHPISTPPSSRSKNRSDSVSSDHHERSGPTPVSLMTNDDVEEYLQHQRENNFDVRRQQQEKLLKKQLKELEQKTKRAQDEQLQQLKQIEQLKRKEKEQEDSRNKKKDPKRKKKRRRKKSSIGRYTEKDSKKEQVIEKKSNGVLRPPQANPSVPRHKAARGSLGNSIVDDYIPGTGGDEDIKADSGSVVAATLSDETLRLMTDESSVQNYSPTHSISTRSTVSEFVKIADYSSSDGEDEQYVHPLDRPDETFEVVKVHSTWKRSRRQLRLSRYHLENLRKGKPSHRHNYNSIKVVSLVAPNKLTITVKGYPKLTYISDIANHIVTQIDERLPVALSYDQNVNTHGEILTDRIDPMVLSRASIASETSSIDSTEHRSRHRRRQYKAGQLFAVPQGVHHPTMPNFKLYIKNACNDYQVDGHLQAFAEQKISNLLISDYFNSSTVSEESRIRMSEPTKILASKKAFNPDNVPSDVANSTSSSFYLTNSSSVPTSSRPPRSSITRQIPLPSAGSSISDDGFLLFTPTSLPADTPANFPQHDVHSVNFELRSKESATADVCGSCRAVLPKTDSERRWCEYTGKFCCTECHFNERAFIPSRLIHYLDVSLFPVCREAKQFLDRVYHQPNIPRAYIKPSLYFRSKSLQSLLQLQTQLTNITPFLDACNDQTKLSIILSSRHYFLFEAEYLSMRDFVEILGEGLCERVAQAICSFIQHARLECGDCADIPVYCADCADPKPLKGAQIPRDLECAVCGGSFKVYQERT